jgi:membrane associated rhomboid family serine protease
VIPLRDINRSQTQPHVTRILLIINVVVFIVVLLPEFASSNWIFALLGLSDSPSLDAAVTDYGMIPCLILRGQNLHTLFTSMFLHADIWHIGGNMLFLYVFGDNIEDTFGHARYLAFYFISGLTADLAFIGTQLLSSDPTALLVPTIGASGAIAGVLGAYLILYPRARILTLIFIGLVFIVPLPAILFLGFWLIYQLIYSLLALGVEAATGIAYWAHIGGFVAGIFFGLVWRGRKRKQPFY